MRFRETYLPPGEATLLGELPSTAQGLAVSSVPRVHGLAYDPVERMTLWDVAEHGFARRETRTGQVLDPLAQRVRPRCTGKRPGAVPTRGSGEETVRQEEEREAAVGGGLAPVGSGPASRRCLLPHSQSYAVLKRCW